MAIERFKPEGLHATPGYHHVTIVDAGRTAYLAGQCPLDADGDVVGTTHDEAGLAAQVDQVAANALVALAAAGAAPDDVVGGVIYVVSDDGAALASVWKRLTESALAPVFTTASTLLGVSQLGFSHQRVELDLTAALNGRIRHPRVRVARGISRPAAPASAGSWSLLVDEAGERGVAGVENSGSVPAFCADTSAAWPSPLKKMTSSERHWMTAPPVALIDAEEWSSWFRAKGCVTS